MSQASSSTICKYDVFLSFRGEDTRRNIVSHLYNALQQRGIRTFKDDERLETGKPISDELLKAIEEARFAVVIFSKRYASSRWCLEELAHIIKCKNELEQIVIPVFYDVSPSDVRHQNPPFADSFSQHEEKYRDDMEKVQRWRGAFVEAGKISGYHLLNFKDEAECIKKLVDDIFPKSLQFTSPFPERLVGMKSRVEKVTSLLDMESNDVRSIGIWGMGGIGKTEIANVLHQRYRHRFEADCFLENVGELHQKNGLTWLLQQVICKLLGEKLTLTSEHEGMNILENMLRWKKVLFILDDVTHREQLESLVGGPEWFGMGSRIVLTARDKHLLISHVGEKVYEVQLLSEDEALELFSRHAFRDKSPKEDFMELSRQVVEHAGGLPLALKVLGSSFCGRDEKQWRQMIDRLKRIPHKDILGKLKLSFDGLDKDEKELFLDIVFLDIARLNRSYRYHLCAELVLRDASHGFQIDYLIEKSLLSINIHNNIVMHNMIREMGENVIREEYADSRLWLPEEVCDLFKGSLKSEKVESLCIPIDYCFEDDLVNYCNIFKRMQSLKILKVGTFSRNCAITYLPSSLRFIDWPGYSSFSLPESFEPSQLVVLCLFGSQLAELWPMSKKLSNLKHLDLGGSCELRKTPNFGDMPILERLNLQGCVNLEEVHPSLGHCRMLTYLNLGFCHKLKKLPKFVYMESLETLYLRHCTSLQEFPEICGDMHRLSKLFVGSPWIRSLPLSLSGLRELDLIDCEILESIPDAFRNLTYLRILDCNKLATLPNNLFESQQLENIIIYRCENLKKLPSFIEAESIKKLEISNCPKLDTFPEIKGDMHCLICLRLVSTGVREVPSFVWHLRSLKFLFLEGFEDLVSLPDSLCNMMNLRHLSVSGCKKLEKLPENIGDLQELQTLDASETAISQAPPSITKLGNLCRLSFSHEQQFHNIFGGLPEDLGSLHFLEELNISGSNISCLPKSINKLSRLHCLNIQFCRNLNELPGELPPNLRELVADYHLALKSIRDLVICCLKLCRLAISNYGTVSSEQVNVFLQHFRRTCIQCDFHQRDYFLIYFPDQIRIPELLDYDRFINQEDISIDLNPSWYTDKFMGFWVSYRPTTLDARLDATLVCKSDPERKYSLNRHIFGYSSMLQYYTTLDVKYPFIRCAYIPFETLWDASGNKEGKNPNDYYMLELSQQEKKEVCWGIRLEYENEAMSDIDHQKKRRKHDGTVCMYPSQISNETLHQEKGLTGLAKVVILKLLGEKMTLSSEHEGVIILKNRLRRMKVLLILDDVNHREQLEVLVGGPERFGMGSRIILTARDKHLLFSHVGENMYEVQLLSQAEALELFSMHAFGEKSPKEDFMELSRQVVKHAGGLPLALKVLGSSFRGRDKEQWSDMIDRLMRIPHKDILGKLRLSFDGLDKDEKELFLDIAFMDIARCFGVGSFDLYVGLVRRDVSRRLLINCLIEKCLLSIETNNSIMMHNMIKEMGANVIRGKEYEYVNSRIWLPEEVCDLFKGKLKSKKVESLCIPNSCYFEDDVVNYSNVFKRMQSLKVLIVGYGTFISNCGITYLPSSLWFIDWPWYPSISLPESFEPSQLVVLRICGRRLVELWPISKKLSNLKHLDLRKSYQLRKTPNFDDMPNLERLDLGLCENLEEVHPSLGHCRMLTSLNLGYCVKLKKLPKFVCMESLETLNLDECRSLQEFPEICGDMHRLSILSVGSPWIRSLPLSLSGLRDLQLAGCEVLESIPDAYRNLEILYISGCNKLATLPNSLFESQQLEDLLICGCENLKKLPSFIQTESLKRLTISNCPKLDTFPEIKGDMHCLNDLRLVSTGVREVPSFVWHLRGLEYLFLGGFEDLVSLPDSLCNMTNLQCLSVRGCTKLEKLPENIGDLQELRKLDASETAISQPPPSITKLGNLCRLSFSHEQQFHNIFGGLPEDLGSLHFLEELNVSGSNISCLPKSINKLSRLHCLNIQFCRNLNELPGELPPKLEELIADYHLALKSIGDLVICCPKLCRLKISNYGTVSSEQVNVFLQHFRKTCIQCDFHQRHYFHIYFPDQVRILELDYDRFINVEDISIDLNPSWYTDKFMGFWISYGPSSRLCDTLEATLVCKSDPERKYSLKRYISGYHWTAKYTILDVKYPFICCAYIPFETLWDAFGNKQGKNPNDYYMLEVSKMGKEEELCWGIRLEYE